MNSDEGQKPSMTIAIAALNEEGNIQAAIDDALAALDHYNIEGEIIVVNDGSTDNTSSLARARMEKDRRVKLIIDKRRAAPRNRGFVLGRCLPGSGGYRDHVSRGQ